MEKIKAFIANNETVDALNNLMSDAEIKAKLKQILNKLSFVPGRQYMDFLHEYAYLAYKDVEFLGLCEESLEKHSLYASTFVLQKYYPSTKGFFIIEKRGEGYNVLIDSDDNIYNFFAGDSEAPEPLNTKFYDYVLSRMDI